MRLLPRVEKKCTTTICTQVTHANVGSGTTIKVITVLKRTEYQYHALPLDNYREPSGIIYQQKMRKRYGSVLQLRRGKQ